jgi:hypothetical protein
LRQEISHGKISHENIRLEEYMPDISSSRSQKLN